MYTQNSRLSQSLIDSNQERNYKNNTAAFRDMRSEAVMQRKLQSIAQSSSVRSVVQLEKFDAGNGAQWHIHYDHIKLGNNKDSRVNFNNRSKKEIRKELGEKIDRYGLNVGGDLAASFQQCIAYINANF